MSLCSECDHHGIGGECAVWIQRKHLESEANNCHTFTVKGIVKTMNETVKENVKSFADLGAEIGNLVEEKSKAYGDWNVPGQMLRLLYPEGVKTEQVDDMLTIVRILDKIRRIATKKDAFGESPYRDIIGYAMQGAKKDEQTKR